MCATPGFSFARLRAPRGCIFLSPPRSGERRTLRPLRSPRQSVRRSMASARAARAEARTLWRARAERRTLWRAGARCVPGTRGTCCAFWHGIGASCTSNAEDRDVFITGMLPTGGINSVKLNVCCGNSEVSFSDFRQPSTRAFWWDNWQELWAESNRTVLEGGGLTHWHVYCDTCEETCVLCDECDCDAANSACASCRFTFG